MVPIIGRGVTKVMLTVVGRIAVLGFTFIGASRLVACPVIPAEPNTALLTR